MDKREQRLETVSYGKQVFMKLFVNGIYYRAPHMHPDVEVELVCGDGYKVITRDTSFEAGKGDVLVFNPYENHELKSVCEDRVQVLILQISRDWFRSLQLGTVTFGKTLVKADGSDGLEKFYADCAALSIDYFTGGQLSQLRCSKDLSALMYDLMQIVPWEDGTEQADDSSQARFRELLAYMEANCMKKLTLKDLSGIINFSPQYLSHLFAKNLGMPMREYITKLRFNHAIRLIDTTSLPLIDVCYESGFSDYKYMAEAFRRELGMTPQEYQKANGVIPEKSYNTTNEYIYPDKQAMGIVNMVMKDLIPGYGK